MEQPVPYKAYQVTEPKPRVEFPVWGVILVMVGALVTACAETTTRPAAIVSITAPPPTWMPHGARMERAGGAPDVAKGGDTSSRAYYYGVTAYESRFAPASFSLFLSHQLEFTNLGSVRHNITIPA